MEKIEYVSWLALGFKKVVIFIIGSLSHSLTYAQAYGNAVGSRKVCIALEI
jgi:hypothetical protein